MLRDLTDHNYIIMPMSVEKFQGKLERITWDFGLNQLKPVWNVKAKIIWAVKEISQLLKYQFYSKLFLSFLECSINCTYSGILFRVWIRILVLENIAYVTWYLAPLSPVTTLDQFSILYRYVFTTTIIHASCSVWDLGPSILWHHHQKHSFSASFSFLPTHQFFSAPDWIPDLASLLYHMGYWTLWK